MDVVAHGLWATAGAIGLRRKTRMATSLGWTAFWGVFPDLFSFTLPAVVRIWWWLTGATRSLLPDPQGPRHFQFVWTLYHCSHSLVVFGLAFGLAWLVARRPVLSMLGWLLHVTIDVFTHGGIFAPHFLWPASSYGWDGTPWETTWLLAANYVSLAAVYGIVFRSVRSARQRVGVAAPEPPGRPGGDEPHALR